MYFTTLLLIMWYSSPSNPFIGLKESGSVLKQLEQELQACEKTEASLSAAHRAARDNLASQEKKARLLERALADDNTALADKKQVLDQVSVYSSTLC